MRFVNLFALIAVSQLCALPASAEPSLSTSPLVAEAGLGWSAACSPSLSFCEVASRFVSLRRASTPSAGWIVSLKAGTATASSRVEEVQVRGDCACDKIVLTVGETLKAVERPDLLTITDAPRASALLNLLLTPSQEKAVIHYWSGGWGKEEVNTRGLAEALAWVDRSQNRPEADRSGAALPPDAPVVPVSMVADADALTDPERTSKDLPPPVRDLFAQDLRRGCHPHPSNSNRPYFQAHWVDRDRAVFFVECTRPDLSPSYRVYTASGPTYADARPIELVQWDERAFRAGRVPSARRDVPTMPMFMPAETLVLNHHRNGIESCRIEHTYRWLKGRYRLLAVRASECSATIGGSLPERTLRFQVPASEQ